MTEWFSRTISSGPIERVWFIFDVLAAKSMPWPEFNRRCWKLYGTGRMEPDKEMS